MRSFNKAAIPPFTDRLESLRSWMSSGAGKYILRIERNLIEHELSYIFGYHSVCMSVTPEQGLLDSTQTNRKYILNPSPLKDQPSLLVTDPYHWPVEPNSLDLVMLHHMLESSDRPHRLLSEACNAIIPGGKLVIVGFNPFSLCHMASFVLPSYRKLFRGVQFISPNRMKDWLTLLGFSVEKMQEGAYLFPLNRHIGGLSAELVEQRCYQWFMPFGAFYIIVATRETPGMIPIKPRWSQIRKPLVQQPIASSSRVEKSP